MRGVKFLIKFVDALRPDLLFATSMVMKLTGAVERA